MITNTAKLAVSLWLSWQCFLKDASAIIWIYKMNKLATSACDTPPCRQGQAGLRPVLRSLDRGGWMPFRVAGSLSDQKTMNGL